MSAAASRHPPPADLSADETRAYEQLLYLYTKGIGYAHRDAVAPADAVRARGFARRPGGLDARPRREELRGHLTAFVGEQPVGNLTRDEVLDNITLTWLTNTGISSARLYRENALGFFDVKGVVRPGRRDRLSRRSSTKPRGAGPSRRIPTSSTSTRSTGATISPPGRSRSSSPPRYGRLPVASLDEPVRPRALALARRGGRVDQLRAAQPRRAARQRRPRELLDADLHQLAAPGAVRPRLVAGLPRRRAGRHRRPHAGVLVRARRRPRAPGDEGAGHRLPGRGRQRLRDLERVRQPLLAGALLRRRGGHHPRPALRRGTLRAVGAGDPAAARTSSASSSPSRGIGVEAEADWDHLRTPETYLGYARGERFASPAAPCSTSPALRAPRAPSPSTTGRSPASGRSGARRSCSTRPAAASRSASTRATRTSCCRRSAGADPLPRAARRRGPGPRHTAWTSTRTGTACSRTAALPARARAGRGPRAHAGDHVPRAGGRGLLVHVRVVRPPLSVALGSAAPRGARRRPSGAPGRRAS